MELRVVDRVSELIGKTPMVRLRRLVEKGMAEVLVKLEWMNPGGSIKDRIAKSMMDEAEKVGALQKGMTIVEPTSGNTGIGLALVGVEKGYRVILVMPDTMSRERMQLLKAYGAEIILTPGNKGMSGAIERANSLLKSAPQEYFIPQQFNNPNNAKAHRETTGPEIIKQMDGHLDAFVAGVGTGGTLMGVGEALKQHIPHCRVIAVEPYASPVLSGGKPGKTQIQGIGAGFIPEIVNLNKIDRVMTVTDEEAFTCARRLAKEEGILGGISTGANVFAALQVAKELGEGHRIVTISPSNGERYLSTPLYREG